MAENDKPDKDEEGKPKVLKGQAALTLARQGKDAWNAWAEENPGRRVSFWKANFTTEANKRISFNGFFFPGEVSFTEATFLYGHFDGAIFRGEALFSNATFEDNASFTETIFEHRAAFFTTSFKASSVFLRAIFKDIAQYAGASFNGIVSFSGSRFQIVPDLRGTDFKNHVTLHGIAVNFRRRAQYGDADKYRRLKELSVNARDHDREQMFFAYELIANRGYETRGLKTWPSHLYELFGDFGRSLLRPCSWLFGVWFGFGIFYRWLETSDKTNHIWDGLLFSTAQLFPFLGGAKGTLHDAGKVLFGAPPFDTVINVMALAEGGLGILFIFLIGLALRNRFRI